MTEIYLPEVLKIILLLQVLEETSTMSFFGEISSALPGNEVLELILLLQVLEETSTMSFFG